MHSNLEANLVIICVSLPALRQFVKHFAPKLMGYDSQANSSGPSYLKNSAGNNTFGSVPISRSAKKYGRMEDGSVLEMTGNFDKEEAEERTRELSDNGSEKAIWQTRTVTVQHYQN